MCEKLSHQYLFPSDKIDFRETRDIAINPVKYFKSIFKVSWLVQVIQTACFAHSVLQESNLSSRINTSLRITVKKTVTKFIASDQVYNFMGLIKGKLAY